MNPAMSQSMTQAAYPVPHAEYSTDTVIYKGGPPNQRGPLPQVSLGSANFIVKSYSTCQSEPLLRAILGSVKFIVGVPKPPSQSLPLPQVRLVQIIVSVCMAHLMEPLPQVSFVSANFKVGVAHPIRMYHSQRLAWVQLLELL
jgi:hypothetical protein